MASTQVTVTASTTHPTSGIHFDSAYIRTLPGILKIIECIVNISGFISMTVITTNYIFQAGYFYNFVSMSAFIISLFLLIFYLFHFVDVIHFIPWLLAEIIFSLLWAVLYIIASSIAASWASAHSALGSAAFFGFVAVVLYLYEAFSKFRIRKSEGSGMSPATSG